MPNIKFVGLLPKLHYPVQRIRMRGLMDENPEQFSINLVNETTCYSPQNITYHFKVILNMQPQVLIENNKRDGEWVDHMERELDAFDGQTFGLEFALVYEEDTIRVYNMQEDGYNFLTSYESPFALSSVQAVQVWGDVQKINEFSLLYD